MQKIFFQWFLLLKNQRDHPKQVFQSVQANITTGSMRKMKNIPFGKE
jgi:hypothetical protein